MDRYSIKVGREFSNSTNKVRKVIDIHTNYNESTNSPRRELVSYVVVGKEDKVHSCYMGSFIRWVNS